MRTSVVVIPSDHLISVDGLAYIFEFSAPDNLHAIQWHTGSGHYEYTDATANLPLTEKDYDDKVYPYVRLWEREHQKAVQARAEAELEYNKLPNVKERKLAELTFALNQVRETAWVMSSLGFQADANDTANTNVDGLIKSMTALNLTSTYFCDYNNVTHLVTIDDLKTLQLEIIQNGQALYAQKWAIRDAINAAKKKEVVDAIEIKFTMMDFTNDVG